MEQPKSIRILKAFTPFIHILRAFNLDSLQANYRQNIPLMLGVATCIALILNMIVLAGWHLFENELVLVEFVVAGPIMLTMAQTLLTFVVLIAKNRMISETIRGMQGVIDQREALIPIACST